MVENPNGGNNIEDLTIRDLFALSAESLTELMARLEAENYQQTAKKLSSLSEPIPWSRVQSEVGGMLSAALSNSVLETWACAWKKYQDVKNDVEESRNSPDAVVLSGLVEHSIDSTLHPYVEVFLGSKLIQKITFDVVLTTLIKGLVLGIKNGRIISLQLSKCEWTGTIATRGVTLVERKLAELNLPGRIVLKHGISLGSQSDN